jgi:hypothetical protein
VDVATLSNLRDQFFDESHSPCSKHLPGVGLSLEKNASVLRLIGVWLPQLNWVVTKNFLPTCEQKGWCCHDPSLFSFFYQSFRCPAAFHTALTRSLSLIN